VNESTRGGSEDERDTDGEVGLEEMKEGGREGAGQPMKVGRGGREMVRERG